MSKGKKVGDLTEQDIDQLEYFDLKAIQEGIRQAELSLTDAGNTKESLDRKTFFYYPYLFHCLLPSSL